MATITEPSMPRASDWVFNFDIPDNIDLGDALSVDNTIPEDFDLANSDIGSVCHSPAASEEDFLIPPDTQAPYDLRQNVERNIVFTNHDADESGNYNPDLEAREGTLEPIRCKATKKGKKAEKPPKPTRPSKPSRPANPAKSRKAAKAKKSGTAKKAEKGKMVRPNKGGEKDNTAEGFTERERKKTKSRMKLTKSAYRPPGKSRTRTKYLTDEDLKDIMDEYEDECAPSRESTPEMIMEDQAGNRGPVMEIQTSFAHPIRFSLGPIEKCGFCEVTLFGITGHFEKSVAVIQWDTGLGFTEMGGGHCDKHSPTGMCGTCTQSRAAIALCDISMR